MFYWCLNKHTAPRLKRYIGQARTIPHCVQCRSTFSKPMIIQCLIGMTIKDMHPTHTANLFLFLEKKHKKAQTTDTSEQSYQSSVSRLQS